MNAVTIVNFSHPLTAEHLAEIADITGESIPPGQVIAIPQESFDLDMPFSAQAEALVARAPLDANAWQTTPLILNLPSLAPIAALVLAIVLSKKGSLPSILRMRPEESGMITRWRVAEIIDLNALRNAVRVSRIESP